jgi:adenosylhomocysteine nucleosidase
VRVLHLPGGKLPTYTLDDVSVTCAGIGRQAAARATEMTIQQFHPELIVSVGFAGAVDPALGIGRIVVPGTVIDLESQQRFLSARGEGVLVSANGIATPEEKAALHQKYRALAVDMEAAAVAERASAHSVQFMTIKSISDTATTTLPDFSRFVRENGRFATLPTLWPELRKLAANTAVAAKSLTFAIKDSVLDGSLLRAPDSKPALNSR